MIDQHASFRNITGPNPPEGMKNDDIMQINELAKQIRVQGRTPLETRGLI